VSWFAGLFYLPRIFVNHAMATEPADIARLKLMGGQVVPFRHADCLAGNWFLAWCCGSLTAFSGGCCMPKVLLVVFLYAYHLLLRHAG